MNKRCERIFVQLCAAGLTREAAASMLGNMRAESELISNNAQNGMTALSDGEYTARADRGELDFAGDGIGYGLCQWTYPTRKAALLAYARSLGKSLGDEGMQVEFCIKELREDYPGLWAELKSGRDTERMTARICREYERPAADNSQLRIEYAKGFLRELGGTQDGEKGRDEFWPPRTIALGMEGGDVLLWQALMGARGYACPVSGSFDNDTRAATLSFQSDYMLIPDGIPGPNTWGEALSL